LGRKATEFQEGDGKRDSYHLKPSLPPEEGILWCLKKLKIGDIDSSGCSALDRERGLLSFLTIAIPEELRKVRIVPGGRFTEWGRGNQAHRTSS